MGIFGLKVPELLIILGIIIVLFGVGRIGKIGSELGAGIKGFKDSLQWNDKDDNDADKTTEIK